MTLNMNNIYPYIAEALSQIVPETRYATIVKRLSAVFRNPVTDDTLLKRAIYTPHYLVRLKARLYLLLLSLVDVTDEMFQGFVETLPVNQDGVIPNDLLLFETYTDDTVQGLVVRSLLGQLWVTVTEFTSKTNTWDYSTFLDELLELKSGEGLRLMNFTTELDKVYEEELKRLEERE